MSHLKKLHEAGADLCRPDVAEAHALLVVTSVQDAGSWGNAVREAGLPFEFQFDLLRPRLRARRREVAVELIEWCREHGFIGVGPLGSTEADLLKRATEAFGNLAKAAELLGLPEMPVLDTPDQVTCRICGKRLRTLTSHLRKAHGLTTPEYKERFGVEYVTCANVRKATSQGIASSPRHNYEPLSQEQVLQRLRELEAELGPLNGERLKGAGHQYLLLMCKRRFGTFRAAAKVAGVVYENPQAGKWDKDKVIAEIKKLHEAGEPLSTSYVGRNNGPLSNAAIKRFGSWRKAMSAAGLDLDDFAQRRRPTKEECDEDAREWVRKHGAMSAKQVQTTDNGLFQRLTRRYGSIEKTAKALDLPYVRHQRKPLTRAQAVAAMRMRVKEGKALNRSAVADEFKALYRAIDRHFESYEECLREAGVDPDSLKPDVWRPTEEELRQLVHEWCDANGGALISSRLRKDNPKLHRELKKRYGDFKAAAIAMGVADWQSEKWTRSAVADKLRLLASNNDGLRPWMVRNYENLHEHVVRHFGSVEEAAAELNLEYVEPGKRTQWTAPMVVAELQRLHAAGVRMSLSQVKQHHSSFGSVTRRIFGSWRNAVLAAGLEPWQQWNYDDPKALKQYMEEWIAEKGKLDEMKLKGDRKGLYRALIDRYGSFDIALKALSLDTGRS